MTNASPNALSSVKRWLWWLTKLLFFAAVFVFILLVILSKIGGSSDLLKGAVEDYVSEATGYTATIETLNYLNFFPDIGLSLENLELHADDKNAETVGRVKSIRFLSGFWDVAFGTGKVKGLHVEDVAIQDNVLLNYPVSIKKLSIENQDDQDKGRLLINGRIGPHKLDGQVDLEATGERWGRTYVFGKEKPLQITLGPATFSANLKNTFSGLLLENIVLNFEQNKAVTGTLTVNTSRMKHDISGSLTLYPGQTTLNPDIRVESDQEQMTVSGTIKADTLHTGDVDGTSQALKIADFFEKTFAPKKNPGSAQSKKPLRVNIDTQVEKLILAEHNLGPLRASTEMVDDLLTIKPQDTFLGGKSGGLITYDMNVQIPTLKADLTLKDINYGALQKQLGKKQAEITGTGNLHLDISGKGKTSSELKKTLNGTLQFIGGKGQFRSGALNIWGGGLVNAIMPDINPEEKLGVNCAIMDWSVENGLATGKALFIDGTHVTLSGKGTYDISKDYLDLSLKPKPKEIAIGDIASEVSITGPISQPKIAPSMLGLGKKIGGLILSTVNPAFLLLNLTDLGLNENHPCAAYVKEAQ